ncbi:MAG: protein kinase domain-containing protein [Thermoanaerobaculia bacterium]
MADKGIASARLTRLGRYEVLSELGKGAMGVVYLAKDPAIGRLVAIKTIRASSVGDDDAESREFRERFVREAQTAGILSHPNIVTIHDIGEDVSKQTSFIAMEYIEGKNLKMLLADKAQLSYDQIADMIAQVAEAIDYAHRKGIIHRDVKPANIIITTDGKVKITDFGIAKVASSNLTTSGQFLGTPNYMSPEQVSGAPVDGRSDIFSLGVVLYELLTRRKPFLGENLTAISYKIVHEDFTPPAELSSDVPADFNPIVARAMAKDPWNRYQRGKDLALALRQVHAHLEEQRALADLGTRVSEAELMPTLKLANLDNLLAEAPEDTKRSAGASARRARARSTEVLPPKPAGEEPSGPVQRPEPLPDAAPATLSKAKSRVSSRPTAGELKGQAARGAKTAPEDDVGAARPLVSPRPFGPPPRPAPAAEDEMGWLAVLRRIARVVAGTDWRKLVHAELNPIWFWRVVIGTAAVLWVALPGAFLLRRMVVSRPSVPLDRALEREIREQKESLEMGKKLFGAGQYEQSLALFRRFLARSPGNAQARQYAQMAESALQMREEEVRKSAEAQKVIELAQAAFAQGDYAEAERRAAEALALDGGQVEAQRIRQEAAGKIGEVEAAKKERAQAAASASRRVAAASPVESRAEKAAPTPTAASVASAAANPVLRLLFDSPVSEGNVMVAVNDQILLRRSFSFKRKEGFFKTVKETGTVEAVVPVQPGPIAVKVWLSGPDIPVSSLATVNAELSGGETRILRLEYSSGRLSARIQ